MERKSKSVWLNIVRLVVSFSALCLAREFLNPSVRAVLEKFNVRHDQPTTSTKCSFVERLNYTWSRILYKYLALRQTKRYIDDVQRLVRSYNRRMHSGLPRGMCPEEAELETSQKLLQARHRARLAAEDDYVEKYRKTRPLARGTLVRISINPEVFGSKPYYQKWSDSTYWVDQVITHRPR